MSERQNKEAIVAEIVENIKESEGIVIVDYRGLNVKDITDLRNKYREKNVKYKVYKNTLVNLAFEQVGIEVVPEVLKGPNGFAFGLDDPVSVAKVTNDFAKDHEDLEIKAGVVSGSMVGVDEVIALSKLPSEEELQGMLVNVLNSPIQSFASVTAGILTSLVYAVQAIKDKKEQEAA